MMPLAHGLVVVFRIRFGPNGPAHAARIVVRDSTD